jgi:UDP-3-O-[3-hydroxymyristoyl] glucosamine N-acyltransferase
MNFAIYPDTWIRDLPLLNFGDGAYLSNKATIGTNIALSNGSILVDSIEFKDNSHLGHLSMVAPGAIVEESVEIGVGCAIGINARIGPKTRIGPGSSVGHGAQVSAGVATGAMCCIGSGTKIASGVVLPNCASIPNRHSISDQSSANRVVNAVVGKGRIRTSDLLQELTRFLASSGG